MRKMVSHRAAMTAILFVLISAFAASDVSAQAENKGSENACGTDATLASLSPEQREQLLSSAVASLVPAGELLLYIHIPPTTGTTILPGSPNATGFRSTIISSQRVVPAPGLTQQKAGQIISLVKDDFSPFNIKFTTDYNEFLAYPTNNKHICILTRSPSDLGQGQQVAGVAPLAGFGLRTPSNPSFVFAAVAGPDPAAIADVVSHEVAHTLGLVHQRRYDASCNALAEYHPTIGTGRLAFTPIMGNGFGGISNWWSQECPTDLGPIQRDFEVLSSVVALVPDDFSLASNAVPVSLPVAGLLGAAGDSDTLRISLPANATLRASSTNIDLQVAVFETDGTPIGTFNDPDTPEVRFDVTAGVKDVVISAVSNANMDAQFMTGQYSLIKLAACTAGERTWDGGGATNNWSDAANWTCDSVPSQSDVVIFDANSTKDSTVDDDYNIKALRVELGYTGVITETAGSLVRVGIGDVISDSAFASGTFVCGVGGGFQLFNTFFTQAAGTFNCRAGDFAQNGGSRITLTGGTFNAPNSGISILGPYNQSGGTFDCGSGTVDVASNGGFNLSGGQFDCTNATLVSTVGSFNLSGGIFDMPAGTATFGFSGGGSQMNRGPGGVIRHNNGTVILQQCLFLFNGPAQDLFDVVVSTGQNNIRGTMRVLGTLDLQSGTVADDSATGVVEVLGDMFIDPAYSGAGSVATFQIVGNAARSIVLPTGMSGRFNPFVLDAPSTTVGGSGPGQINFSSASIRSGFFNGAGSSINLGSFSQSGGTFTCGGGLITTSSNNIMPFAGGTFDCTSSNLSSDGATFDLTGGTFRMPAGTFALGLTSQASLNITSAVDLETNGGTLDLVNAVVRFDNGAGTREFDNVTTRTAVIVGTLKVLGALNMETGFVRNGFLEAVGPVNISPTYGEHPGSCCTENRLVLSGSATRVVTIPSTIPARFQGLDLRAPNTTVRLGGNGTAPLSNVTIDQGRFEMSAASMEVASAGFGGSFTQNFGSFAGGGGLMTFRDRIVINGGSFDCGSSDLTISSSPFGTQLTLNGGVFTAPAGTMNIATTDVFRGPAATFNHNNGTILVTGNTSRFNFIGGASSIDLNNLIVDVAGTNRLVSGSNVRVLGNMVLENGSLGGNTFEVQGDLTVSPTFSDLTDDPADLIFAGGRPQTFTNNGGAMPSGSLTINKTPGSTLIAATDFVQGFSAGAGAQPFNIASGTLYLSNASDLTTFGNLSVGASGRLLNDSSTSITLGGNISNSGVIDLQGGGTGCPDADSIVIRSSAPGTQRSWSGPGRYRLVDVDVRDMTGPTGTGNTTKRLFSSTNSGNNNASWDFSNAANCPVELSLSPSAASVGINQPRTFSAGGGFFPYTYSIAVNNSGGTINPTTGVYNAGPTAGVSDTVRVTDAFGATAESQVTIFGAPTKLGFIVQPSSNTAGQTLSPSVKVAIQDQFGTTVPTAVIGISLSIANNPSSGTLSGTLARNSVNGVAEFSDLRIDRAGTGYTLRATGSGVTAATSDPFSVNAGTPAQLAFTVQPSSVNAGSVIAPAVSVAVTDAVGNVVTGASDPVTIGIANNPAAGTLSGTLTANALNGVAAFNSLSIDNAGSGYTLSATASRLSSVTSSGFNVIDPFVVTSAADSGPGSLRAAITAANASPGTQTIRFNIPGTGPFSIGLVTPLPSVSDAVIDAATQPGYAGTPLVELRPVGSVSVGFLTIRATIRGFAINGFQDAVMANTDSTVQGNFIGTDTSGTIARPNVRGLRITGSNVLIGGASASDRNVISGNGTGIVINPGGDLNSPVTIRGNYIGTSVSGFAALPNTVFGITSTVGSNPVFVGGALPGEGNIIAFNGNGGVRPLSRRMAIRGNSIHSNLGGASGANIGLGFGGSVSNDPLDVDLGPNDLQNVPIIRSAASVPGHTFVTGTLSSAANRTYDIDFFSNPEPTCGSSPAGRAFIGTRQVTTGPTGIVQFSFDLPSAAAIGGTVSATATDPDGNTSSFSNCVGPVSAATFSISGRITDSAGNGISGVTVRPQNSRRTVVTDSAGNYAFRNLPAAQDYTLVPSKPSTTFSPASRTISGLSSNTTGQDFTVNRDPEIRGRVLSTLNGGPVGFVTISLTGAASRTTQTDNNGNFVFADLASGGYTVTPSRPGLTLTPGSASFALGTADQVVNFGAEGSSAPGRIFFRDRNGRLASTKPDGSGTVVIDPTRRDYVRMDMSSDGRKIAFGGGGEIISTMNSDGSGLVNAPIPGLSPATAVAWSPDGTRIAYVAGSSIRTAFPDGTGVVNVFTANSQACRPGLEIDWTADPNKIIFDASNDKICSLDLSTGTAVEIASNVVFPSVSPDGSRIACVRIGSSLGDIQLMNIDGTAATLFADVSGVSLQRVKWSPDGSHLIFRTAQGTVVTQNVNGTSRKEVSPNDPMFNLTWAPEVQVATPAGTNVTAASGAVSISFSSVDAGGQTSIVPIAAAAAGTFPGGFVIAGQAYEISTTASVTPPVGVCFVVPNTVASTGSAFSRLSILHGEGGVLVDRTTSRTFSTRTICATTSSLSPFVLAHHVDSNAPSVTGIVRDSDDRPISGVPVTLSGTETRYTETDSDGRFYFVNLTEGGNYSVRPQQAGYLFGPSSEDLVDLSGEQTLAFVGTAASFQIAGRVTNGAGSGIAGARVTLDGPVSSIAQTDAAGDYVFTGLPADSPYTVTVNAGSLTFLPSQLEVAGLTADVSGADFIAISPTAAAAAISGRTVTPDGYGLVNAEVLLVDQAGRARRTLSSSLGYFRFEDLRAGESYVLSVNSKRFLFQPRTVNVGDDVTEVELTGEPR